MNLGQLRSTTYPLYMHMYYYPWPIQWNSAAVQYPSVGTGAEPEMPLKVIALRP